MRYFVLCLGLAAAGCATGSTPRVVTQTPAGISYECIGAFGCQATPQDVADMAQRHCRAAGKNAQQVSLGVAPSGNLRASYNCI